MLTTAPKGYSPAYLARQAGVPLSVVATNLGSCLAGLTRHPPHEKAPKNNSDVWLTDGDHALVIARLQFAAVHSQLTSLRAHLGATTTDPTIQPAPAKSEQRKGIQMALTITDKQRAQAEAFGNAPEDVEFLCQIRTFCADGSVIKHDGTKLTRAQFDRERAARRKRHGLEETPN